MPSLSRAIAAHTQATPSSPPAEPQEILDQLIDSISSSDSQTTLQLLDQVESSYINIRHSTLQLTPLEALFSRYPQLAEPDLKILDSLFEKGAALEMVDEKILKTMMDLENDSQDSTEVVREFEAKLIGKFGELDQAKEVVSRDAQEADRAESSPLTSLPASTPTPNRSPHPRSRSRSTPPLLRTNHSVSSPRSFPLSQPSPSFSPETSRTLPQAKPPSYPPGPQPLPPPPPLLANFPSEAISITAQAELVRLFLPIPYDTTLDTVYYYFEHHLGVRISNVTLQSSQTPSRALIDVEKSIFDSGELRRRIDVAEGKGRMFPNAAGSLWRLNPREFDYKLSKNRWNEHRNGVQENAQYHNLGSIAIAAQPDGFLGSQDGSSTRGKTQNIEPIKFILSGFSPQTDPFTITTIISDVTGHPIELSCRQEGDDELIVKFWVDEEEIAERIESELGKFAFEGRMITARRVSSSVRHASRPMELEQEVPKIKQEESIEEGELEFARIVEQKREDEQGSIMARSHPSPRYEEEEEVTTDPREREEVSDRRRRRRSSSPDRRAHSYSYSRSPSPVKRRRVRENDRDRTGRDGRSRRYDSDEEEEVSSRRRRRKRQDRYRSRSPARSRHSHRYHSASPSPPRQSRYRSRSSSFDRHRRRSRKNRSASPGHRRRSPSPSPPRHSSRRIYHHSRNTARRNSLLDSSHVSRRLGKRESTADGSDFRRSTSRQPIYHNDAPYPSFPRSRSPSTVSFRLDEFDELKPGRRNAYVESGSFYHDSSVSRRDRSDSPAITRLGEGRDLERWYAWED